MLDIEDKNKTEKFRKFAIEKPFKLNLILGAVLVFLIIIYFFFIKPSSDPSIFKKIKNDAKEINSSLNKFQNKLDTLNQWQTKQDIEQ